MTAGAGPAPLIVAGRRLEYLRTGRADGGPVIVLLHEGLGSVALWKDFPAVLADATGLGVFAYSRAGYGNSDPARLPRQKQYLHEEALEVLPGVLDFIGSDQFIPVGHSDGASIALLHGGLVGDARVQAMVVIAPHVFVEPVCIEQVAAARREFEQGNVRGKMAKYHADPEAAFRGWNDIWLDPGFRDWNIESCLPHIHVPTLVVQGDRDEYATLDQVHAVCRGIGPLAEPCVLPDCGHAPHRDQPDLLLAAVNAFLSRHDLQPR